jgi:Arc/MetJ-type ribon-helix-helix transcriptional regulator
MESVPYREGEKMDKEKSIDVSIPASLYKKIEEKIKGTEIDSVSSYVTKVIEENLAKKEGASETLNKEDEEKVKERLKALGYLD